MDEYTFPPNVAALVEGKPLVDPRDWHVALVGWLREKRPPRHAQRNQPLWGIYTEILRPGNGVLYASWQSITHAGGWASNSPAQNFVKWLEREGWLLHAGKLPGKGVNVWILAIPG